MNYILPKSVDLSKFEIIQNNTIFKIKHTYQYEYDIVIFGMIININFTKIDKNYNDYLIHIDSKTKENIQFYESYLNQKIPNYSSLLKHDNQKTYLRIIRNRIIDNLLNQTMNNFYLNIKYVKKSGFLNIPVINIILNER